MGGSFPLGLFLLESSRLLATSLSGRHRKAMPHAEACWEKTLFHPVLLTCSSFLSLKPKFPAKNANGGEKKRSHDNGHCFPSHTVPWAHDSMCHLTSAFPRPEHRTSSWPPTKMLKSAQLLSGRPRSCPQVLPLKVSPLTTVATL